MSQFLISSSILAADFTCLQDQIQQAVKAGVDWIHVDVMDGMFVPNISMGPMIVEACRRITDLPLDVHLMIEQPERYIEDFVKAGASRISVHIENAPHIHRTLEQIRGLGAKPGIVINPGTAVVQLEAVIPFIDMVLVMTVNPGFGGQEYIPQSAAKIAAVQEMLAVQASEALIEVDGGITAETLPATYAAGARVFVAGSSIFKHPGGIAAGVQALREAVG